MVAREDLRVHTASLALKPDIAPSGLLRIVKRYARAGNFLQRKIRRKLIPGLRISWRWSTHGLMAILEHHNAEPVESNKGRALVYSLPRIGLAKVPTR
jgi:hypothetical protein